MESIEKLKELIKLSNNIVFFGGAGVSTESNIPDFRSEKGLYNQNKYQYRAKEILSRTFYNLHKEEFYHFYINEMIYPKAKPNQAHLALTKLEKQGKLKAIITQNIDGLHQEAGSKNVIELHGSVKRNHCLKCNTFYNELELIKYYGICPKCHNYIKPDVVLYEEMLKENDINDAILYISNCDTLIVGGTSLSVYPAASFIKFFKGENLVLINNEKTTYDQYATLIIRNKIGKVLSQVI
ncbi:MAG: NAD-dependent protein deacylase [Staphylococcus sp.]|jgi:NAD-dependent deacetylase|nr:NAD-dependent protein deacylase [Staphylococcus sp.]